MDKDNLNQKPISTLTKAELVQLSGSSPNPPAPVRKQKQPLIIILAAALAIVIAAATIIIINLNHRLSEAPVKTSSTVDPEYTPPEEEDDNTINASQYFSEQQAIVDSEGASTTEKLDAIISMANLDAAFGRFDQAEARLNVINKENLDQLQLFDLYASYAYIYDCAGDSAKVEEYNLLADEALEIYYAHQETTPPEENK